MSFVVTGLQSVGLASSSDNIVLNDTLSRSGVVLVSTLNLADQTYSFETWQNGAVTSLSGAPLYAGGINDNGTVAGETESSAGSTHAVLWTQGSVSSLSDLGLGSAAAALNNQGCVVGTVVTAGGTSMAAMWQNGVLTVLGTSASGALAVNDAGQIVGFSQTSTGADHAVLWQNGTASDLGTAAGGTSSYASAINQSGQIVGYSEAGSTPTAVIWEDGVATVLTKLPSSEDSEANTINDAGIVGGYSNSSDGMHAVIWQNGAVIDLNTLLPSDSGWTLNSVSTINDQDQIVGSGVLNGVQTPFFLSLGEGSILYESVHAVLSNAGANNAPYWIEDSAANVQSSFDALEPLAKAGEIASITLTDASPSLAITDAQFKADGDVLGGLTGKYGLTVSGVALQDVTSMFLVGSHVTSATVTDNAADIAANLDFLNQYVVTKFVSGISLTDGGIPTLSIGLPQLWYDAGVLDVLAGDFDLSIAVTLPGHTITAFQSSSGSHGNIGVFSGDVDSYEISSASNGQSGTVTVTSSAGSDYLVGFNSLQFKDAAIILASPGSGLPELYAAVLNREPDVAGLAYYEQQIESGQGPSMLQLATNFLNSPEYTGNPAHAYAQGAAGDAQFITDTYQNLLHRAPEAGAVAYYQAVIGLFTANLAPGTAAYAAAEIQGHAQVLVNFSASAEFLGDVEITAQHPADQQHWLLLV
jgi:probable HAF family extracellular repeat protein